MAPKKRSDADPADTTTIKASNTADNAAINQETTVSTENEIVETSPEPTSDTALAVADPLSVKLELAKVFPAFHRENFLMLERPTTEELFATVQGLAPEDRDRVMALIRKTRPSKQGAHTSRQGFQPIEIRLNQGTGSDPARPRNSIPGNFYTDDSRNLESPFVATVIGFYEGRTQWPPRGGDSKSPLCYSMDRKQGSRYGSCAACPNATKPYNKDGCGRDISLFLVDKELTGIYRLRFQKTSTSAGENLIRIITKSDNIWSRWVTFEAQERKDEKEGRRWFVMKATPVTDPRKPENEYVSPKMDELLSQLSRVIDSDVYYPALAGVYGRKSEGAVEEQAGGEQIDMSALQGDAVDYSTNA